MDGALDWRRYLVDSHGGASESEPCPKCGEVTCRVSGFVDFASETKAAYFVKFSRGRPGSGAAIELVIGDWTDGSTNDDRSLVTIEYRVGKDGGFMVQDPPARPLPRDWK